MKVKQEIRKAFDAVRCEDGLKERTRDRVIRRMGQKQPKPALRRMRLAVSLACLLVFAGSGFGGYQLYYAEAATISIDVNPSIELGINRWGRVVEEVPYGRDGEMVLRQVSLRHLEYEEALNRLLGSEVMQDYLKKDALLSITLENRGGDGILLENLQSCVDTTLKQCHSQARTEYVSVDGHMCQEAHSLGMSVGKYHAIQELLTADPQATLDEFKDKSMKEIKGHTEHCGHKAQETGEKETGEKAAGGCHNRGHHGGRED
ncbi:hypothetical protein LK536_11435 [Lachnoclostridium pacaense]|uniref:Anti-sigma factor RsgI-like middle domain-containing protein n=1 Tax=Enterocloster hominis (ex Hitch et al. 2024) TaxID=1917870 RepID=A0ABV1D6R4_9FIRM|nr:hypothetical protein [Lachnoclostridium pacaense]MCC2876886.1 hypothetical protein [Lachnoclostridium pacaense]MCD8171056.1 hypothetical protein [Clostridiales bacterium]